jgi:hypothetical protein
MAVVICLALLSALALALAIWSFIKYRRIRERYAPIVDADEAVRKAEREFRRRAEALERQESDARARMSSHENEVRSRLAREEGEARARVQKLAGDYTSAKTLYDRLRHELSLVEENVEDVSIGLYRPHYDFTTSEKFKAKLEAVRDQLKDLARGGKAAVCGNSWTINGSLAEGARMQKQYTKLLLRAFNGECDAAIAKVTWNNVTRMEERIVKAFEAINKLGGIMQMSITSGYLALRIQELRLEYELEEKKKEEADEQKRLREQMREEEKVARELERAQEEAEADEERYERALEKARAEAARATGAKVDALNAKVQALEAQLQEAHERRERAISQAQLTKAGHVYIISNVGSFGDKVFKIGMTRRQQPMDRVRELGDASVPFEFDVHAMISSSDAPALENDFHRHFGAKRVNLVNNRKEFFFVGIDEIVEFAEKRRLKVEITKLAEARQYRESVARREQTSKPAPSAPAKQTFPDNLFGTAA